MNNFEERIKVLEEAVEKEIQIVNRLIDITDEQNKQIHELIQLLIQLLKER